MKFSTVLTLGFASLAMAAPAATHHKAGGAKPTGVAPHHGKAHPTGIAGDRATHHPRPTGVAESDDSVNEDAVDYEQLHAIVANYRRSHEDVEGAALPTGHHGGKKGGKHSKGGAKPTGVADFEKRQFGHHGHGHPTGGFGAGFPHPTGGFGAGFPHPTGGFGAGFPHPTGGFEKRAGHGHHPGHGHATGGFGAGFPRPTGGVQRRQFGGKPHHTGGHAHPTGVHEGFAHPTGAPKGIHTKTKSAKAPVHT